ncbi:endothelin-converting enzyme-like 1 [Amblyomma americanum]
MWRPADGAVRGRNAAAAGAEASSCCSSTSSGSSNSDPGHVSDGKRLLYLLRRPGFKRIDFTEMSELLEMRRAAQRAFAARAVTTVDASSQTTELPELGLGPQVDSVAVRQVGWHMNPRFKKVLIATAGFCSVALFIYLVSAVWIRVRYRHLFHATSGTGYIDHARLPLFSGCESTACRMYMAAIETSLNRSQDPCKNLYRFVCDGWKQDHRMLSVLDAAEDLMYGRALNTIEWAPRDIRKQGPAHSVASIVEEKVVELAKSCIEPSESSLHRLKMFMADHHLPWPMTSRWDLLEILLDLSGNWNLHLWFQVTLDLRPSRKVTGDPVLKIGHSAAFRAWIASMRAFAGQPRRSAQSVRYQQYVRSMLLLFDVTESQADDLVTVIEAMNRLTLAVLGPAMAEPEHRTLRMSIRNLTKTTTPGIAAGRLLLLLNEHFIWAQQFSSNDIVQVENPGLLRAVVYLLGLKSEMREALTLSLGLRVVHELGWMADQQIADLTLELMGLPTSVHSRRCLVQIEDSVGIAWLSLFPSNRGFQTLVEDVRDILAEIVMRHSRSVLDVRAQGNDAMWSFLASVLPQPTPGASFFTYWLNLMSARWRLQQRNLTNVLKPGSVLMNRWSVHGPLTVSNDYSVFPLYHPDLPPAVNYGGAGRLIADEILRSVFQDPMYGKRSRRRQPSPMLHRNESLPAESPSEWSPHHVDAKALLAALNAYRLGTLRHPSGPSSRESSRAQDRLFFVASCYALCSSGDYVDELYGDASRRCNEPVMTLSEFTAAFKCETPNQH